MQRNGLSAIQHPSQTVCSHRSSYFSDLSEDRGVGFEPMTFRPSAQNAAPGLELKTVRPTDDFDPN